MRNFRVDEYAVSQVIGVVLMTGMTVIMISAVAISIFSFSLPESAPHAKIVIVEAKGGINKYLHENVIMLKHKGGDALNENDTKIIITGKGYKYTGADPEYHSAQDLRVVYYDLTGDNDLLGANEEIVEGTSWYAGEQIELYGRDGHLAENMVDSKWKLQSGSEVVITIIDIPTNQVIAVTSATVKHP